MKGNFFKGPITGRHVLYAMLIFFGVIFVVNGVFIYLARSTFTGVSTEDAYHKGLAYNDVIRAAGSQHTLGWQAVDAGRRASGDVSGSRGSAFARIDGAGGGASSHYARV
jgi:nitrogen fixation protein FixH